MVMLRVRVAWIVSHKGSKSSPQVTYYSPVTQGSTSHILSCSPHQSHSHSLEKYGHCLTKIVPSWTIVRKTKCGYID